jgi:hypothetical protein
LDLVSSWRRQRTLTMRLPIVNGEEKNFWREEAFFGNDSVPELIRRQAARAVGGADGGTLLIVALIL